MIRAFGSLIFIVILSCARSSTADTIKLSADEWCPYNCKPDSDRPGFLIEIAEAIFQKAGHRVAYDVRPWARAVADVRSGKIDGVVGTSKDDTPDLVFPAVDQGFYAYGVYVRVDDSWSLVTLDSFKNRKIGLIRDYRYLEFSDYFERHVGNPQIEVTSGNSALAQNVDKLLRGRIDTVIEDVQVMDYFLYEKGLKDKIKMVGVGKSNAVYIAFSTKNPKSAEYASLLATGIEDLRKTGEFEQILKKYGVSLSRSRD